MMRDILILAAGLLLVPACSDNPNIPPMVSGTPHADLMKATDDHGDLRDDNRYIVVFTPDAGNPASLVDALAQENGVTVHFRYRRVLRGFSATIPPEAMEGIRHNPHVAFVERDGVVGIGTQYNPPSWGLDRLDQYPLPLDNQYSYVNTGSGVTVYILDSGIRMDHGEFSGRVSSGYDFIDNDSDASDCHGHGTHVAGTVGGTNVGVAKGVSLVAVRVLDCSGYGYWSQVIAGIDYVVNNRVGPAVINMSISGSYSSSLNTAVANAVSAGVTCVVAAGNDNTDASVKSPASAASAITVGATTTTDTRASFSNYGNVLDLFAPGASIYSSTMNGTNTYASWSGTSMAAPHVAGVAALYLAAHPGATPTEIVGALAASAGGNLLSDIGAGSPNLLLHNQFGTPPPPPPPSIVVHVSSATATVTRNKSKWRANLVIEVKTAAGLAVPGAVVTVTWSGGASGQTTAGTNSSGAAMVTTPWHNTRSVPSLLMTVSGITGTGLVYDAAANTATLPVFIAP